MTKTRDNSYKSPKCIFLLEFSVLFWYFYRANKHYSMKKVITFGEIPPRYIQRKGTTFFAGNQINALWRRRVYVAVSLAIHGFDYRIPLRVAKMTYWRLFALQDIRKYNCSLLTTYRLAVDRLGILLFWNWCWYQGQVRLFYDRAN